MPALNRRPPSEELQRLIAAFLKAETDIINEIARLRTGGLVDYHAEAALARVQAILRKLEDESWTYVPRMIEREFYVQHPEARKPLDIPETAAKHASGYANAAALTGEQTDIVQRLTMNLMGEIDAAAATVTATLQSALIGRVEPDIFRRVGLEQVLAMEATGRGAYKELPKFVEALRREGITAFIDKAGRRWSLHTYGSMVLRTTTRQAEVLSVLTRDPEHDLYKISSHNTTCRRCAPLEGRVYSRSGTDPDFPPLAAAFGKVDKNGPDTLANSWLNIHPNCLHVLIAWTPAGRSEEELRKIKAFSSFTTNPPDRDPRTEKQIEAYRLKERGRAKWLADYRQFERYRLTIPDDTPRTFAAFQRHKQADDEKYKRWEKEYRKRNLALEKLRLESLPSAAYTQDRTAAVRALIRSDQIEKRLNIGHQNKHIRESGMYVPGRSYLYGGKDMAQSLVDRYHGTGEPIFTRAGDWAKKEVVSQDSVIGVNIDVQTGEETETTRFTIHYGKNGTHIVPAKERGQNDGLR